MSERPRQKLIKYSARDWPASRSSGHKLGEESGEHKTPGEQGISDPKANGAADGYKP
jgi:hypothetical protein